MENVCSQEVCLHGQAVLTKIRDGMQSGVLVWARTGTLGVENSPCNPPGDTAYGLKQCIPSSHSIFYTKCESFFWPTHWGEFSSMLICARAKCNLLHFNISILTVHHFPFWLGFDIWASTVLSLFQPKHEFYHQNRPIAKHYKSPFQMIYLVFESLTKQDSMLISWSK